MSSLLTACGGGGDGSPETATTAGSIPIQASDNSTNSGSGAATSGTTTSTTSTTTTTGTTSGTEATQASGTGDSASTTSGASSGSAAASAPTDAASASTTTTVTTVTTTTTSPALAASSPASAVATVARPAGNIGSGFYVVGSKLYDPAGNEFRIRGVNHDHWDQTAAYVGIPLTGANTERIHIDFSQTSATNLAVVNAAVLSRIVPIVGNWGGTCYQDPAHLSAVVDTWVAQASTWTGVLNAHGMVNIANEWGPSNSAVWRDSYIAAVARMRAAGYNGTLVIDSGGCGQDVGDLQNYAAAVLAADPQHNILFDLHVYGSFAEPATKNQQGLSASMTALAATGLPIVIGEFGPGNNIGASPTLVTPQQVVSAAEGAGFGWLVWAYDDNNLAGCKTNDNWFGMTNYCAVYTGKQSELTAFGQIMVPMLQSLAKRAVVF